MHMVQNVRGAVIGNCEASYVHAIWTIFCTDFELEYITPLCILPYSLCMVPFILNQLSQAF